MQKNTLTDDDERKALEVVNRMLWVHGPSGTDGPAKWQYYVPLTWEGSGVEVTYHIIHWTNHKAVGNKYGAVSSYIDEDTRRGSPHGVVWCDTLEQAINVMMEYYDLWEQSKSNS